MRRLAVLVVVLVLLPASGALASSSVNGTNATIELAGDAGANAVTVTDLGGGTVRIADPSGIAVSGTCVLNAGNADCPVTPTTLLRADLGAGTDSFTPAAGFTQPLLVLGGAGDDTITGGPGTDFLDGGDGDDTLAGGAGLDTLTGGLGRDRLDGNADDDFLDGQAGDDTLNGGDGEDFLSGTGDNDELDGGDGDDVLSGGEDDDILVGGQGADGIEGDKGIDVVDYAARTQPLTLTVGNGLADDGEAGEGDEIGFSVENVIGGAAADRITGSSIANVLDGRAGDDAIEMRGDGGGDRALCDGGADIVGADETDDVAADCETVVRGFPAPAAPQEPQPVPAVAAPGAPLAAGQVSLLRPRVTPGVSFRVTPRRDRRAPYTFLVRGRIDVPGGLAALACSDLALLDVHVKRGAATLLSARPRLAPDCTFRARVSFKGPARLKRTKLRFTASFLGNAYLVPRRATSVAVHAGRA